MKSLIILLLSVPLFSSGQEFIKQECSYGMTIRTRWNFADYSPNESVTISGSMPGPYIVFLPSEGPGIDTPQHNVLIEFPWGNAGGSGNAFGAEFDFSNGVTLVQQGFTRQICAPLPITLEYIRIEAGMLTWKTDIETNVSYYRIDASPEGGILDSVGRVEAKGAGIYTYSLDNIKEAGNKGWMWLALLGLAIFPWFDKKKAALSLCIVMATISCTKSVEVPASNKPLKYFRIHEQDFSGYSWNSPVVVRTQ